MISERTFITEKHKKSVKFIAVFLAILMLVMTFQMSRVTAFADGNDVSSYLNTTGKNSWQIVSGGYTGNTADKKTTYSADSSVRVQKNVVPTDVENEFLVYLSIDTKSTTEAIKKYFETATYNATPSNKSHASDIGDIVDSVGGNEKVQVSTTESFQGGSSAEVKVVNSKGETIQEKLTLYWDSSNNFTLFLKLSDGRYMLLGLSIKKQNGNQKIQELKLSAAGEQAIFEEIVKSQTLDSVTDEMGDYITYLNEVKGSYSEEPAYDFNTKTLTWKPILNENCDKVVVKDGNVTTRWNLNVAELVYKVKLDVTKTGFNSCANNMNSTIGDPQSYPVNKSATLTYKENNSTKTVDFPVPYVRGLLYEFQFIKVDSEDTEKKLSGAEFSVTNGEVSDEGNGVYIAKRLPIGNYTLTELEAPEGYIAIEGPWNGYIEGYTQNPDNYNNSSNSEFLRWLGNGTDWEIKNIPKKTVTVEKKVNGKIETTTSFPFSYSYTFNGEFFQENSFYLEKGGTKSFDVPKGATVTLSETLDDDYEIEKVEVGSQEVTPTNGSYTFEVNSDVTVTVTNKPIDKYVRVTKQWADDVEKKPVTIGIYKSNILVRKVTLNESNQWTCEHQIALGDSLNDYAIRETAVDGSADNLAKYTVTESSSTAIETTNQTKRQVKSFTITNSLGYVDITVKKHVTGNMGDRDKEFEFTVKINGTDTGEPFRLKDSGEYPLIVPIGAKLEITEKDYGSYIPTSKFEILKNGSTVIVEEGKSTITINSVPQNGGTVEFTNENNVGIDTGITLDSLPYAISIAGAVCLLAIVIMKRRRRLENCI